MALNKRLFIGGADACTTETADKFGDSSGVLLYSMDYDASDASGTADGSPTDVTFGVEGQINTGARFNGTSSFVDTNYTLTTDTTFSFSWWMNADSPTTNHYIFNDGNGTGHDGSLAIYHNTSGQLGMWIGANGSGYAFGVLTITGGLSGSWMHFAVSVNGSTATVYKNGSSEGTISLTPHSTAGILTLIIGRLGHFNGFLFKGDLDQIRYFNKAISATEVGELYAETACVYTATTNNINYPTTNLAYYKLDNSAEDEKGSYDGTETNIEYRFGRFGQAAVFNASSSKIEVSNPVIPNGAASISFWYNPNGSTGTQYILGQGVATASKGITVYYHNLAFGGLVAKGTSSLAGSATGSTIFNNKNWHHIVFTWDGSTTSNAFKIYVNGSLEAQGTSDTSSASIGTYTNFAIGGLNGGTFAGGKVDQLRIFGSELSAANVTSLYNEKPETDTSNFKAVLYEGTGATQYISNVGFQPDFVWTKSRTSASWHWLVDSIVGGTLPMASNAQNGSISRPNHIQSFDANGFTLGSDGTSNGNGFNVVAWCWKAGGEAVAGTGTNVSSVSLSANQEAGFSIVKYTGGLTSATTSTGASVQHGLGAPPDLIISKALTGTHIWSVRSTALDDMADTLWLQDSRNVITGYRTSYPIASSTNDVMYLNYMNSVNVNNQEVIAYCFRSISGYSKIGTYEGNGTTTNVDLGFDLSWIIIKNVDTSSTAWNIVDTRRDTDTTLNLFLQANTSGQEANTTICSLITDGFSVTGTNTFNNSNGDTFIYMAFK